MPTTCDVVIHGHEVKRPAAHIGSVESVNAGHVAKAGVP